MCEFFSCVSDGNGKVFYFDHDVRRKIIKRELDYDDTDSHTSIADYFEFKGEKEDTLNKFEYNPLTKAFRIDTKDDSAKVRSFCKSLDFSRIVPELAIKPILNPFKNIQRNTDKVTFNEIELLKKWASVRASVWASVRASVWASVRASVWDSVWDSVWASVWDSVWGYVSSFFLLEAWKGVKHEKGENPFQSCIDLWEAGIVPSFDGKIWRLHAGKNAKIVWEGEI